ncbi:guanylate cyclase soluble subunit beta-2-like isoform X2 [Saccostrea cucullata]
MLRTLGKDFHTFVQNLDLLHSLLALTYKGMRPPHFRCEKKDGKLLVHVFTVRPGMYPAAIGMLTEVARQIFDTRINMSVVTRKTGEIFKQKYCEHVITEVKVLEEQKMAAITGEDQLMTNHVQSKLQQLAHARENYVVAVPELSLNTALPFSVVFDKNMFIQSAGLHLKTLCPEIQQEQSKINNIFDIKEPEVKFEYNAIMSCNSSYMYFFLQPKVKNRNGTPPKSDCPILRGHMVPLEDKEEIMFIGSPHFDSLGDLISSSSYLKNIPQDNMTMEIMFMNEQRRADVEMSKKLDETTAAMKKLAAALDQEKKKTDTLLYQMLPVKVANQLRDGGNVQAEKHENVTILFSDIVTFTNMAALCHPMDIVELLNDLFQRFDELTTKHDIYKVETIGDAYMVVSGVPEATDDHAIRIANMGLDMIQQTSHVINPVTNKSIQIRVGIHTGPVVSGVVGTKMPRYCLFGDTVNTASRMESHGLPGRVHISNTTHSEIREVGYILERRGGLDVKGKGIMDTYFINGVSDNFDASRKSQTQQEEHREHERIQIKRISPTPEKRPSPTSGSNSSFCSVM